jgi:hypothetical protein
MSLHQELEFEADQLRDIVLFELRTAQGQVRRQLMRARNMLWLVGTQLHQTGNDDDVEIQKLWDMWKEALNITFRVVADLYVL